MIKQIKFITIFTLLLLGCNDINSLTKNTSRIHQPEKNVLIKKDIFRSVCSAKEMSEMHIHTDLYAWGFSPLLTETKRHCEHLNLKKLSKMNCQYSEDLMQYAGINLSRDNTGWDKFIYENETICQNALEIYNAHGEES